ASGRSARRNGARIGQQASASWLFGFFAGIRLTRQQLPGGVCDDLVTWRDSFLDKVAFGGGPGGVEFGPHEGTALLLDITIELAAADEHRRGGDQRTALGLAHGVPSQQMIAFPGLTVF